MRITGGEPLLRKGVVGFINKLSKTPGLEELTLTTNGILLGKMAAELKEAGLNRVNISLDTLKPERFREITRGGDLSLVLDGIREAKKAGLLPIKLNVVLIKGFNDDEIGDFINLSAAEGLIVRFIELMPIGNCAGWSKEHYISADEVLAIHPELVALEETHGNTGPARYYSLVDGQAMIGFINPISHSFCSQCNRVRLTADGKIKPCLHSDEEIDMRIPLRGGGTGEEVKSEIRRALETTIYQKPQDHQFNNNEDAIKREMYKIGG